MILYPVVGRNGEKRPTAAAFGGQRGDAASSGFRFHPIIDCRHRVDVLPDAAPTV